ncbi:MAG: replication initiator protein A [Pseudobutyrivibrio sp.]|nr:replication initiator protein A [Pseudobutyrivibrio sp.]
MDKLNTNYFYGNEAEQFDFIEIPKELVVSEEFSSVSMDAKLLYGMMVDRMGLARKNLWIDEDNHVYIIYPVDTMSEEMNMSKRKITELLKELDQIGLIERVRLGRGFPDRIYVKNFNARMN